MKRRLLNLLTALSLVLCVATVVLWVRSYWVSDAVLWSSGSGERGAQTIRGTLAFVETDVPHRRTRVRWDRFYGDLPSPWEDASPPSLPNRLGFGYRFRLLPTANIRLPNPDPDVPALPPVIGSRIVLVPLWFPAILFALLPAARLYRRVRPHHTSGHCLACGYDLRATSGRCPECGGVAGRAAG